MILPITKTQIITSDLHVSCSLFCLEGGSLFFLLSPSNANIAWACVHNTECSLQINTHFFLTFKTLVLSQVKHDITYF